MIFHRYDKIDKTFETHKDCKIDQYVIGPLPMIVLCMEVVDLVKSLLDIYLIVLMSGGNKMADKKGISDEGGEERKLARILSIKVT